MARIIQPVPGACNRGFAVSFSAVAIRILALGNPLRRDDGVGPVLARALKEVPGPHRVEVFQVPPVPPPWHPQDRVLILDAVQAPSLEPGTLVELEGTRLLALPPEIRFSSHGLSLREWLALASLDPGWPEELRFLGIVGQAFGQGEGLSPAVRAAVPRALARIRRWLHRTSHLGKPPGLP